MTRLDHQHRRLCDQEGCSGPAAGNAQEGIRRTRRQDRADRRSAKGRNITYRARFSGFDEQTAKAACQQIKKRKSVCTIQGPA
jgi:hypothetical protein